MHELSIAMSIIDVASEEVERAGSTIVAVHLKLGPLSGVVPEALVSAYELAREGSPLADSRLVIEQVPAFAWCEHCQARRQIESIQRICCPACGQPTPEILSGRELLVTALEVLDDSTNADARSPEASAQAQ